MSALCEVMKGLIERLIEQGELINEFVTERNGRGGFNNKSTTKINYRCRRVGPRNRPESERLHAKVKAIEDDTGGMVVRRSARLSRKALVD